MLFKRPEWFDRAACRGLDPSLFYSDRDGNSDINMTSAIAVCRECPVILECLKYAIEIGEDDYGIWGGVSPKRRRPRSAEKTIRDTEMIVESRESIILTPRARRRRIQNARSR